VRDLIENYWELAYARATVAVRRSSLQLANDQLSLTRKMFERGTVAESAIKAAKYGVATRDEALLRAIDDVQTASLQLRKNAGLEVGPDVGDLAPTDDLVTEDRMWEIEATLDVAVKHNPRLAAAKQGIAIGGIEVDRKSNAILPQVDVTVSGGVIGAGTDPQTAWNSTTAGSYEVSAGLNFQWEIGGSARAAAQSARI